MNTIRALPLIVALSVLCTPANVYAQAPTDGFVISAFFLDKIQTSGTTTLWIAIKNSTGVPYASCTATWEYSWLSAVPNGQGFYEATASPHGCANPLWIVLPGESRFECFDVKVLPEAAATLTIDVKVLGKPVGSTDVPMGRVLSWEGTMADAIALGEKLKAAKLQLAR